MSDGIQVETDGLNKFSGQVQDDTSRTLEPGYSDARVSFGTGVRFGANNASGSVHAAKTRYAASVEVSTANVEEYMAAARVLADAAAKVAAALDASDSRSAGRTDWISGALAAAAQEAQERRVAAERSVAPGTARAI
ncbi:hypothetical protein OWR29_22130 [Actinoplanes sp. Pm04-4]|uniref:Uncharacterized protein n=1 Tax=Paractinoplanes pyxinae TaxID=2997416 RepID=A0ABT4B2K6_9ACTN|nr:hypothetical protein [Actinoplanes pyxinae]MCY1140705.1 hypothetical protein [Actinoplanes pyxinae]